MNPSQRGGYQCLPQHSVREPHSHNQQQHHATHPWRSTPKNTEVAKVEDHYRSRPGAQHGDSNRGDLCVDDEVIQNSRNEVDCTMMKTDSEVHLKNFINHNLCTTSSAQPDIDLQTGSYPAADEYVSDEQHRATRRRRPPNIPPPPVPPSPASVSLVTGKAPPTVVASPGSRRPLDSVGEGDGLREDADELPQPLTRTNVTIHDRIWSKDVTDSFPDISVTAPPPEVPARPHNKLISDRMCSSGVLSESIESDETASEYSFSSQDTTVYNGAAHAPGNSVDTVQPGRNSVNVGYNDKDNGNAGFTDGLCELDVIPSTSSQDTSVDLEVPREAEPVACSSSSPSTGTQNVKTTAVLFVHKTQKAGRPEDDDGYESTDNMSTGSNNSSTSSANGSAANGVGGKSAPKSNLQPIGEVKSNAASTIVNALKTKGVTEGKVVSPVQLTKTITPRVDLAAYSSMQDSRDGLKIGRQSVLESIKRFSGENNKQIHNNVHSTSHTPNSVVSENNSNVVTETSKTVVRDHFIKPGDVILSVTRTLSLNPDSSNSHGDPEITVTDIKDNIQDVTGLRSTLKPKSILKKGKSRKKVSFNLPEPHGENLSDSVVDFQVEFHDDFHEASGDYDIPSEAEPDYRNTPHPAHHPREADAQDIDSPRTVLRGRIKEHESYTRRLAGVPMSFTDKVNELQRGSDQIVQDLEKACIIRTDFVRSKFTDPHGGVMSNDAHLSQLNQSHTDGVRDETGSPQFSDESDYVNHSAVQDMYNGVPTDDMTGHLQDRENIEIVHQHLQRNGRTDMADGYDMDPSIRTMHPERVPYSHDALDSYFVNRTSNSVLPTQRSMHRENTPFPRSDRHHPRPASTQPGSVQYVDSVQSRDASLTNMPSRDRYFSLERPRKFRTQEEPPAVPVKTHTQDDIKIGSPFSNRRNQFRSSFNSKHSSSFASNEPNFRHSIAGSHRPMSPAVPDGVPKDSESPPSSYVTTANLVAQKKQGMERERLQYNELLSRATNNNMSKPPSGATQLPHPVNGTRHPTDAAASIGRRRLFTDPHPHPSAQRQASPQSSTLPNQTAPLQKAARTTNASHIQPQTSYHTQSLPRRLHQNYPQPQHLQHVPHRQEVQQPSQSSSAPTVTSPGGGNPPNRADGSHRNPKPGAQSVRFATTSDIYKLMQEHGKKTQQIAQEQHRPYRAFHPAKKQDTSV